MEFFEKIPWQFLLAVTAQIYAFLRWKVKNRETKQTIFDVVQESGQDIAESERLMIERIERLENEILQLKKRPDANRRKRKINGRI